MWARGMARKCTTLVAACGCSVAATTAGLALAALLMLIAAASFIDPGLEGGSAICCAPTKLARKTNDTPRGLNIPLPLLQSRRQS